MSLSALSYPSEALSFSSSIRCPLIGLSPGLDTDDGDLRLRPAYLHAVREAGGCPVVLPFSSSDPCKAQSESSFLAAQMDGLLLTGGPDPHPFLYGEETLSGCGSVSMLRDRTDLALFSAFFKLKKPIFGICRGAQLINTALGGTLWQDIPSQIPESLLCHNQPYAPNLTAHQVSVCPQSLLYQITGQSVLAVNSFHHQAIRVPGTGLMISALSSDGVCEAVEYPEHPFLLGVQWHPERLTGTGENAKAAQSLFDHFCACCQQGV